MKREIALFLLLLAGNSFAVQAPEGLQSPGGFFRLLRPSQSKPPQSQKNGDVLASYHMMVQAGKDTLFGYADTPEEATQAQAYWTTALNAAGVETGAPTFSDGMYRIPYRLVNGGAIRDFLADPRQFPPKDEAGLRANSSAAQISLRQAGLPVVAAHVIKVDALLPTYSILYLTRPNERPERETRLRILKAGDAIDFDVFRAAGIPVVQTPEPWMMVYIGPEVGAISLAAKTRDEADGKLARRNEFLLSQGKTIIVSRIAFRNDPDFKFAAEIYFFQ